MTGDVALRSPYERSTKHLGPTRLDHRAELVANNAQVAPPRHIANRGTPAGGRGSRTWQVVEACDRNADVTCDVVGGGAIE
jgi:hypothetical protein|eukprot:COSAG01_NODE_29472_length_636_cov_2.830540_2_plen_80_part_01